MSWRVPPYDAAVAEIEAHVRATYQVHGIVIDPTAADHLRAFATASGDDALRIAIAFANHVLGVDRFFEWTSARD